MGKHKNYSNYYKRNLPEEPKTTIEETATEDKEPVVVETKVSPKEVKQETAIFAIVTGASRVNMRKDPNKNAPVIGVLNQNIKVMVLGKTGYADFWKISAPDLGPGYMMSKFLKEIK